MSIHKYILEFIYKRLYPQKYFSMHTEIFLALLLQMDIHKHVHLK